MQNPITKEMRWQVEIENEELTKQINSLKGRIDAARYQKNKNMELIEKVQLNMELEDARFNKEREELKAQILKVQQNLDKMAGEEEEKKELVNELEDEV